MAALEYLKAAGRSDVGLKRKNNEDCFGMFPSMGVWLVADGMGGGDDGEVASAAVVSEMGKVADACGVPDAGAYAAEDVIRAVIAAADRASSWIFLRAREKRLSGCGSTLVGCVADPTSPGRMIAFHAGDSRLYRIRGRRIKQITTDHSVAEMIGAKDEAKVNPMFRGMVFRAVGIKASVEIDQTAFDVKAEDRILICSDGLSKMVSDREIASIVRNEKDAERAVNALISAANAAGGIDNVTVVVIEVGKLPEAADRIPFPVNTGETETVTSERVTGETGIVISAARKGSECDEQDVSDKVSDEVVTPSTSHVPVADKSVASRNVRRTFRLSRRAIMWIGVGFLLTAAIGGGYLAAHRENRGVQRTDEVYIPDVKPMLNDKLPPKRLETQDTNALIATLLPDKTSHSEQVTNAPRRSAGTRTNSVVGCEELARCCSAAELMMLKEAICRRLDVEKSSQFSEQMNRVLTTAKVVHRLKSPESSDRLVVDLKYALQAAGDVRKTISDTLPLSRSWDLIVAGESSPDVLRQEAASLLKNLAEALR